MEDIINYINSIRQDYSGKELNLDSVDPDPLKQMECWMTDAVQANVPDPVAMTLATVDESGQPSTRIVLLKDYQEGKLVFYTNYLSRKGKEMALNNKIALSFFWVELHRQIRIEGSVEKAGEALSDRYFASRQRESRIAAWASHQSEGLKDRKELERNNAFYTGKFQDKDVPRPPYWGAYECTPHRFEFWQGRPNRLHDRIEYVLTNEGQWQRSRLSP